MWFGSKYRREAEGPVADGLDLVDQLFDSANGDRNIEIRENIFLIYVSAKEPS